MPIYFVSTNLIVFVLYGIRPQLTVPFCHEGVVVHCCMDRARCHQQYKNVMFVVVPLPNVHGFPCELLRWQEFLAEMLDALHEDVNRVIDKPYVAAPEDDEAGSGRSDQDLADEAWDRHVQRNRSVIVDLFQGQLKMESRCTVCDKKVCLS